MFFVSAQIETPTIVSNSSFSRRYQAKDTFGMWERQSCTRSRGRTARVHGPRGFAARAVDAAVLPSSLCRIAYFSHRGAHFCLRGVWGKRGDLRWHPTVKHQSPAAEATNSNCCDRAVAQAKQHTRTTAVKEQQVALLSKYRKKKSN